MRIVKIGLLLLLIVLGATALIYHQNLLFELENSTKMGYKIVDVETGALMYKIDLLKNGMEHPGVWTLDLAQLSLIAMLMINMALLILEFAEVSAKKLESEKQG